MKGTEVGRPVLPRAMAALFCLLLPLAGAELKILTESVPGGTVGESYLAQLQASGGEQPYTWSLAPGSKPLPPGLSLETDTGRIKGTPEQHGFYSFTVRVTDKAGSTDDKNLSIDVDPAPLVITTPSPLPDGTVTVFYSQTFSADGGTGGYTWDLAPDSNPLPAGLSLSAAGVLSGTPTADGAYQFTVRVTDSSNTKSTKLFDLEIHPPPLEITTGSPLPNGTVAVPYSQQFTAQGGKPGYTWSHVSGTLPPGLSLSSAGLLSGTPTAADTYNFTVRVTDTLSTTADKAFALTIQPELVITTSSPLPNGTETVPYSQQFAATGGTPPYSWSLASGSLPPGLSLNASGLLGGTPTADGAYNFVVRVTDSAAVNKDQPFTLTIQAQLVITTSSSLPAGTVQVAYSQQLAATGGTPPYTNWAIASGSLPPGLSLSTAGLLNGTPASEGSYSFTARVTDSADVTADKAFSIEIRSELVITSQSPLPEGTNGERYSFTFEAAGGNPPYSAWAVISGSLPPGLSLSGAGVLSGTPASAGTYTFTVRVRDSASVTATKLFSLEIEAGLRITTPSPLPKGVAGKTYSVTIKADGGTPPYSGWTVVSGTLPAGVSLDGSGGLSGTPASAGTYNFTIRVTDSASATAEKAFALTIEAAALVITTPSPLPGGAAGTAYSLQLAASGGSGAYTWALSGGSLPPGLTLSPSGLISGTPSTSGTFDFTAQVTDSASASAIKSLALTIAAQVLRIETPSPLPTGRVGESYSQTFSATGGAPPYQWSLTGGNLPAGLSLGVTGILDGTPTAAGSFSFRVRVLDSASTAAEAVLDLVIQPLPVPEVVISELPATVAPAEQLTVRLSLAAPYSQELAGELELQFTPDAANPADDPAVKFSTGNRTANFTIPAGATEAVFSTATLAMQTGTVAGTITLRAALRLGEIDVTPSPPPGQTTRLLRIAPMIRSVAARRTSGGLEVEIVGYSTSREIRGVRYQFSAATGSNLQTTELAVDLTQPAGQWYRGSESVAYGGQFTLLQPFTIEGNQNAVASVIVTLTNEVGNSAPVTAQF